MVPVVLGSAVSSNRRVNMVPVTGETISARALGDASVEMKALEQLYKLHWCFRHTELRGLADMLEEKLVVG
jgi:hypothetical protein